MISKATSPEEYIATLPENRKSAIDGLRKTMIVNLPAGFEETMASGMIAYVVPHKLYPKGYHANPDQPLPFISIALQKKFIAIYHMGLYSNKKLLDWFKSEFAKTSQRKLDMGKSCIRFRDPDQIPLGLLAKLASKLTPQQWVKIYEEALAS
jgi:hypothetical protein